MRVELANTLILGALLAACDSADATNAKPDAAADTAAPLDSEDTAEVQTNDAADAGPDSGLVGSDDWQPGNGPLAWVRGKAFSFGPTQGQSVQGGIIRVVELPTIFTTVADDASFALQVPSGAPLSFAFEQDGYAPYQTGTYPIGPEGLDQLGIQAPSKPTFDALADIAGVVPDPERCQIATTVTAAGTDHLPFGGAGLGAKDAVATLTPNPDAIPAVYFAYVSESLIYPNPSRSATSEDGGVLWTNVRPGTYTIAATAPGQSFTSVLIRCRPGVLVNASPPMGIQGL